MLLLGTPALIGVQAALAVGAVGASAGGIATGRRPTGTEVDESSEGEPGAAASDAQIAPSMPVHDGDAAHIGLDETEDPTESDPGSVGSVPPLEPSTEPTPAEGDAAVPAAASKEPARGDRAERARRRQRAAEDMASTFDDEGMGDRNNALMPLVRHMALLTKELAEAHRNLGRVGAERDALRAELARVTGGAVPVVTINESERPKKEERLEVRADTKAAKKAERLGVVSAVEVDPELAEQLSTRAAEVGRRRRLIALAALAAIGLTIVLLPMMNVNIPWGDLSKGGLQSMAVVGPFFTLMMGGFLIYRMIRVGGKAAGWLFPQPEEERRRRRR